MKKWKAEYRDEPDDTDPSRTETLSAPDEAAAHAEGGKRMLPHEKRVNVTPLQDDDDTFELDVSVLSGGAKLG
jgi:hypothetical protein